MHWISVGLASVVRRVVALALWLCVLPAGYDADAVRPDPPAAYDYAQPKLLTATLYEIGSGRQKVLYTFRRTATRTNATVHVERQFLDTNGFVVAAETVVYESNRLVSLQMQEFQARVSGAVRLVPDPNDPATQTCPPPPNRDYTRYLKPDGLKGARIGIPRAYFSTKSF